MATTKKPTTKTEGLPDLDWRAIWTAAKWIAVVAESEVKAQAEGRRKVRTADELASHVAFNRDMKVLAQLAKGTPSSSKR